MTSRIAHFCFNIESWSLQSLRDGGIELYKILRGHRADIEAQRPKLGQISHCLNTSVKNVEEGLANCLSQNDFQYLALFQNHNASKVICVKNRTKFHTF